MNADEPRPDVNAARQNVMNQLCSHPDIVRDLIIKYDRRGAALADAHAENTRLRETLDRTARALGNDRAVHAENARLRAAAAAVRALHHPIPTFKRSCSECTHGCGTGDVELPCNTLRALDAALAPNRSEWTSPDTWRDPDCIECGGEGAACCDPPDAPAPAEGTR